LEAERRKNNVVILGLEEKINKRYIAAVKNVTVRMELETLVTKANCVLRIGGKTEVSDLFW
jgi:hypothetical protein